MTFNRDGYYYDQQIRKYALQFMAIFSGLVVQVGKWNSEDERLISVPIHYGAQDRVVAAIIAGNTQNKMIRLPIMSANVRNIRLATERMHGTGVERRSTYVPSGGLVPDDISVIRQRMPVPYTIEMELALYASNTDQHFQMLEQILPLFEPQLTIQTSDAPFDQQRISSVILTGTQIDSAYPSGTERRSIQSTLTFDLPVWLSIPADVKKDFVNKIFLRIGEVSSGAVSSYEIIADLDSQDMPYDLVFDGESTKI